MISGLLWIVFSLEVVSAGRAPEWPTERSAPWSHQLCRLCSWLGRRQQNTTGPGVLQQFEQNTLQMFHVAWQNGDKTTNGSRELFNNLRLTGPITAVLNIHLKNVIVVHANPFFIDLYVADSFILPNFLQDK